MPFDQANYTPDDPVLRVLLGLRAYHSDRKNWCDTGMYSMDGARCIVAGAAHISRQLCLDDGDGLAPKPVLDALREVCRPYGIITFNEGRGTTHAELLAMYDRAIAARRAEIGA